LTGAFALALSCGERFNAVESSGAAGSGRMPVGGENEGGTHDEGGTTGDGARAGAPLGAEGGAPTPGGTGGSAAASGSSLAGDAGEGGAGDGPDATPEIPLSGLQIWLRADSGVAHAGGVVSSWQDRSGHGRDALQTASNFAPRFIDGALAGKPALVFDGVDDFLKLSTLDVDFSDGLSIFLVLEQETTTLCDAFFEASTGSEENDLNFGDWEDSYNYEVLEENVHDTRYEALLQAPQIAAVIHDADGFASLRSNGRGVGESQIALPAPIKRSQVFIGKTLYQSCGSFHGAIGELLVYNRGVQDRELLKIEQYLRDKWQCCGE
jgi:hypothetical protein